jgi:hypothetical protein
VLPPARTFLSLTIGKPVAMLTRLPPKHREMPWGIFEGKIHITDDFDEPLEEFKDYM